MTAVTDAVATAFRDEWGKVVATLIRTTGDWDLAEECAQDAFALALRRRRRRPAQPSWRLATPWPATGPSTTSASAPTYAAKLEQVVAMATGEWEGEVATTDERRAQRPLRLIFACGHPALAR